MTFPSFFEQVPSLSLRDPLAGLLGAAEGGMLEYRYADAVKWAGHSCPTVAGAWLMTRAALRHLYGEAVPMRGGIRVELRDEQAAGTAGVVGGVIGLITGAAGEGGFKGLGGRQARNGLLNYGVAMPAEFRFTRLDNEATVAIDYHPAAVPPDPALPPLMQKLLAGQAGPDDSASFARLWQDRVRRILLEHADDPELVQIHA
ncbi:MAG: hypothetical protein PHX10_11855 [Gallionellaceae bacterium]|nr:hypothetical protein [Gallionellaceae bacterium]